MATIGRISVAGLSAVAESTQALANINFDFALVKIPPPKEFHDLGLSLTPTRRQKAEEGALHLTARRLGAIFESILPKTPTLIKSYGQRASEIAKSTTGLDRPSLDKGSKVFGTDMLAGQVGVDGASIWAGATSGPGAIQVHLLACMLARMWNGPEAISIWVQILKCRRSEIQDRLAASGSVDIKSAMAAQQEVSRAQLAEWDSSARAWLRIADSTRRLQQKQLLLIIGNLSMFVNSKTVLYDNVIQTWKVGLEGMEKLLNGCPLQMQSGEILLALSSWHLYPDLNVLDSATTFVRQNDPLVLESGILTLGLQNRGGHVDTGLKWSLPLAHLRYYGDPVRRTSSIGPQGSRLSLVEFNMAVLGCVLGSWTTSDADVDRTVKWLVRLSNYVNRVCGLDKDIRNTWLQILGETAQTYLDSTGLNRRVYKQLLQLGRSHASFIGGLSSPFFGLSNVERGIALAKHIEQKIQILRRQATTAKMPWNCVIIRYVSEETGREEYASALPSERISMKRTDSGEEKVTTGYRRWVPEKPRQVPSVREESPGQNVSDPLLHDMFAGFGRDSDNLSHRSTDPLPPARVDYKLQFEIQKAHYEALGEEVLPAEPEHLITVQNMDKPMRVVWGHVGLTPWSTMDLYEYWDGPVKHYEKWLGDDESAAIFLRLDQSPPETPCPLLLGDLELIFEEDNLNLSTLLGTILSAVDSLGDEFIMSMRAISTFNMLYRELKQSTIDVRIFGNRLPQAKSLRFLAPRDRDDELPVAGEPGTHEEVSLDNEFATQSSQTLNEPGSFYEAAHGLGDQSKPDRPPPISHQTEVSASILGSSPKWQPKRLTIEESFSAILYVENNFDIVPTQLKNVMAISSGNSMFIATALLSDPSRKDTRDKVSHVMGNVGRPGTALLVPPLEPRMMKLRLDHWHLINHNDWDGNARDCFGDSTLHLWFTGKIQEVDIGYSGAQDTELYILESVISVHGKGQWIADLDILKALMDRPNIYPFRFKPHVSGQLVKYGVPMTCPEGHDVMYQPSVLPLTAVENWTELLESLTKSCIFLANANWQARLAATLIATAQGRRVFVLLGDVCWRCVQSFLERKELNGPIVYIY